MSDVQAGDPVAAIKEHQAEAEIASIFSDMRATLGTTTVNLS
jgi:hypothetical protein